VEQQPLPLDVELKLQSAERDLQRIRETTNPQYAYYAQQRLIYIVEILQYNWKPETDEG